MTGTKQSSKPGRALLLVLGLIVMFTIVAPCLLAAGIRTFAFEAFEIDGPSMEPTYSNGDRVVVEKSAYGLFSAGAPAVGDVVIARTPDGIDTIKRVIGVPGDRIELAADRVIRNGSPIERVELRGDDFVCARERVGDRSWLTLTSLSAVLDDTPAATVPPGHVFLLGDHRDRSNDSRFARFGMVPFERLKGRVGFRYLGAPSEIPCPE